MKTRINHIRWGIILNYISLLVNILFSIFYTPLMLRILGAGEHGLYSTVSSAMSWLGLLGLGIGSSYIYFYARYDKDNNKDAIASLNGLFLTIFIVIGAVSLVCGLFIANHLPAVFANGMTEAEYKTARILAFILTVNISIGFPASIFNGIIRAHERYVQVKLVSLFQNICTPLITLPLLLMGYGSIGMVAVTTAVNLVAYTFNAVYCFRRLGIQLRFTGFEKGIMKAIFGYSAFIALESLISQFSTGLDKIFITRYWNTAAASVYAIGYSLYSYYEAFAGAMTGMFVARIQKITARLQDDQRSLRESLTHEFIRLGRIQFLIQMLMLFGILFFGRTFIHLWAERGGQDYKDSYSVALLLCASRTIPLLQNIGWVIQRAQNKHRFRTLFYAVMTLMNVVLTMILCRQYGPIGAAVGTAISYVVVDVVVMNIYYEKALHIDISAFWKEIAHMSRGLLIPFAAGVCLWRAQSDWSVGVLLLSLVILRSMQYPWRCLP